MNDLYNRIVELREKKGITGYRMCKDIGIQPSIMTDLKMGRKQTLAPHNLVKVADYFGVTVPYLMYGVEEQKKEPAGNTDRLEDYEEAFLEVARKLSPENRAKLLELAKLYIADQEARK